MSDAFELKVTDYFFIDELASIVTLAYLYLLVEQIIGIFDICL
jgi:hypothetical protein